MTDVASSALLAQPRREIFARFPEDTPDFSVSPQLFCRYDRSSAALWSTLNPKGVPCFSMDLLHDMEKGSQLIEGFFADAKDKHPLRHIIVCSGIPRVFNVGGDLSYFQRLIATQDRARLTEYARTAINVTYRNHVSHNIRGLTTVALLEGDALGGGLECALSSDVVIAEEHVKGGFPEVLFDMFPGMGGLSFLARRVGRKTVEQLTRSGRQYSARELLDLGVFDQVVPTGEGREAVARLLRQREHQAEAHAAMNAIDKMLRPVTLGELNEIVRMWVDSALRLSERGRHWMRRLHQQQVATFGVSNLALVTNDSATALAQ